MKRCYLLLTGAMLAFNVAAYAAGNDQFEPGDAVLTNCHQIYTKGSVKAKVDDGYTIHFPKNSGPINCPPFRWHAEFVLPYQSVPEYRLKFLGGFKQDLLFRTGEKVTMTFDADKRVVKNKAVVDVEAEIIDISSIGAIAVKLVGNDPDAAATFWKWVGGNYIDLRHKALEGERRKRSN